MYRLPPHALPPAVLPPSLDVTAQQSTADDVVVPVGPDGRINVDNPSGRTHVRMDAVGSFNES